LDNVAVQVVSHGAGVLGEDHVAVGAVEDVADRCAAQRRRLQAADLEDQLLLAVVEPADLGVGGLAVIDVTEAAAHALDRAAQGAGDADGAEPAVAQELDGRLAAAAGADLGAGLADLVGAAGDVDAAPALPDVVADRLFDVDVLAGLHGPDGRQRMPVVGRGD